MVLVAHDECPGNLLLILSWLASEERVGPAVTLHVPRPWCRVALLSKLLSVFAADNEDAYNQAYNQPEEHEGHFSHELVGGEAVLDPYTCICCGLEYYLL